MLITSFKTRDQFFDDEFEVTFAENRHAFEETVACLITNRIETRTKKSDHMKKNRRDMLFDEFGRENGDQSTSNG